MKTRVAFSLAVLAGALVTTQLAVGAGNPSITIVSPKNGATISGTSVTAMVSVSNFKLVPPVYVNPPKLTGNQGHIHYVLDNLANFVATRDAAVSLSHTFNNLTPGHHTLIAYLATSQHAQFPGTQRAEVQIAVAAQQTSTVPAQEKPPTPAPKPTPTPQKQPPMKELAKTGGATGQDVPQGSGPGAVIGLLGLVMGLGVFALRRRRP